MNLFMLLTVVISGIAVMLWTRKSYFVAVYLFGLVSIAGLCLEVWQFVAGLPSIPAAELVITFVAISLCLGIVYFTRNLERTLNRGDITIFASIALLAGFLVANRLVINGRIFSPLAGVSRLVGGEDNGKWLNFTSAVETGSPLQLQGGVSAGLAVLLFLTVALMKIVSALVLGGENQLAVTVQSVLIAHAALVVLAPLAISPLIELRSRATSILWGNSDQPQKAQTVGSLSLFFASIFLAVGVAAPLNFGHLSLEYVLVAITFSVTSILIYRDSPNRLLVSLVVFSVAGLVWMPFTYLSLVATFVVMVWALRSSVIPKRRRLSYVSSFTLLFVATLIASLGDLIYLFGQSSESGVPVKSLLIAEGGTMQVDWALALR